MLDHYLEVLARRPGALPGAAAVANARAAGLFTPGHDAFWAAARRQHGDTAGTRVLIEVLLLHRRLPIEAVLTAMATAVRLGRFEVRDDDGLIDFLFYPYYNVIRLSLRKLGTEN